MLSSMLFSQAEGIIIIILIILSNFASPHINYNVSCERVFSVRNKWSFGGGAVYGHWLYSRTFLCSFGSVFQFTCPPLQMHAILSRT